MQSPQNKEVPPSASVQSIVVVNSSQNIAQSGIQSYQSNASDVQNVNQALHQAPQTIPISGITPSGIPGSAPQQPQAQQFNTVTLCFFGQDVVQEIVAKVHEIFATLKSLNPPLGTIATGALSNEKRTKLSDLIKVVKNLFKRLRIIYEKCNDDSQLQGMEYMHIESLIPIKEECYMKASEERETSEFYRLASQEYQELVNEVKQKNRHLKDIIDQLRKIVWEINTMLMMRKS